MTKSCGVLQILLNPHTRTHPHSNSHIHTRFRAKYSNASNLLCAALRFNTFDDKKYINTHHIRIYLSKSSIALGSKGRAHKTRRWSATHTRESEKKQIKSNEIKRHKINQTPSWLTLLQQHLQGIIIYVLKGPNARTTLGSVKCVSVFFLSFLVRSFFFSSLAF